MTDAEVLATLSEADVLTLTLWGEGRGEELEGRVAIGCVIRHRMRDDRWPDTLRDVCLQKLQFSCWQPVGGSANYRAVLDMGHVLSADHASRSANPRDALYRETAWIANGIISGVVRDRVGGANHYLTRALWETAPPSWARGRSPVAFIGRHCFFRL